VLSSVVALFVVGILGFALYQVGNSQAAVKAKDFLRTSEKLKTDIGQVKDFGSIITATVNLQNGNNETTLNLEVIGERQTAVAKVDLVLVSGSNWRVSSASYVNASGQTINLLNPYDSKLIIPVLIA